MAGALGLIVRRSDVASAGEVAWGLSRKYRPYERVQREAVMNDIHEQFMREALAVARAGLQKGELPIGAIVVVEGRIVASAHTMERGEGRFLVHADLLALEAADKLRPFPGKRREASLYVNLEPCLMCLGAA